MIDQLPLLSMLIALPFIGSLLTLMIKHDNSAIAAANARMLGLLVSLGTLGLAIVTWLRFEPMGGYQFAERYSWIPPLGAEYFIAVDGISLPLILLTALLTPLCLLISWTSITDRVKQFVAAFLMLEALVIGVFCALDGLLFYIFWEAMLIPMFLIIGIWGGEQRVYATLKFFLYTFAGSVLMLIALIYLYLQTGTFDLTVMPTMVQDLPLTAQQFLFLAFLAAFAVKIPMWPVHTWLPDAHVQAPTAGSVILAGVLLKMGGYGLLRFSLPLAPDASVYFAPLMFALSAIAIIYASLVAFAQTDIKKLIAYSSVAHMGFVTLGIFAGTTESAQGAVMQMINHGIVSAALFMVIGVVYERLHTRDLAKYGGLTKPMPVFAAVFMIFMLASVGLPGTNSFVGEFLVLVGSYPVAQLATVCAALGVVLGALYMLWLYRKMMFGTPARKAIEKLADINKRELIAFAPLLVLVFVLGLFPNMLLKVTEPSVDRVLAMVELGQTTQNLSADTADIPRHSHKEDAHGH